MDSGLYFSDDVEYFLLDDSAFLFCEGTQELYALNSVAAYIWCCFKSGFDFSETTWRLGRDLALAEPRACAYVRGLAEEWRERGLLAKGNIKTRDKAVQNGSMRPEISGKPFHPPASARFHNTRNFRILSQTFRIRFMSGALEDKVIQAIGHLEIGNITRNGFNIDILEESDGIALAVGSSCIWRCYSLDEIAPAVKSYLFIHSMKHEPHTFAFHAAAVSKGECCFLFPGVAGAGKTTLTARLLQSDFQYVSDDVVLLDQPSHRIRGLPFPLCVKESAVDVLTPFMPTLGNLATHLRADNAKVRYFMPPTDCWNHNEAARSREVQWIVFPEYSPNQEAILRPLSKRETFSRLLNLATIGSHLRADNVSSLVSWIKELECYELRMSSLAAAVKILESLLQSR